MEFDDLAITQTKSNVVQYNACPPKLKRRREYYPFGLQAQRSWTRDNSKNNFTGNGGSEMNPINGWYETFYRGYDPALGRFNQVDPKATLMAGFTPYNYAGNNPAMFNDPNGDRLKAMPPDPGGEGGGGGMDVNWGSLFAMAWAADAMNAEDIRPGARPGKIFGDYSTYNNEELIAAGAAGSQQAKDVYAQRNSNPFWMVYTDDRSTVYLYTDKSFNQDFSKSDTYYAAYKYGQGSNYQASQGASGYNWSPWFTTAGGVSSTFEGANAIGLYQMTNGYKLLPLAEKSTYLAAETTGKALGAAGVGITAVALAYEYSQGKSDSHSLATAFVTGGTFLVGAVAVTLGAPVVATGALVVGIGYGLFSVFGGDNLIDESTEHWGRDLIYSH